MSKFQLHHGDCIEWLRTVDDECVDLVVTDPAYESLEKHRAVGTTTRLKQSDGSSNEWFSIFKNERFPDLMAELFRVMKDGSHAYILCDQETCFDVVKPTAIAAGFRWWKALIWVKTVSASLDELEGMTSSDISIGMGYHWRASHEVIAFIEKGKRKLNNLAWPDVLLDKRIRNGYPTEKPIGLLKTLVLNSSNANEVVIDPFLGSGSTGEAALYVGRHFAGCDVSPKSLARARERLTSRLPSARGGSWPIGEEGTVLVPRRQTGLFGSWEV